MIEHVCAYALLAAEGGPAEAAPAAPATGLFWVPMVLILVVFFWFTSRSQKKRERERQSMLDTINPKDKVVTIGGIHGRVLQVKDDAFVLRVDDDKDVRISVQKSAVSRKLGDEDDEQEAEIS